MDARSHWDLDPDVSFLNHGSFGACPREVLAEQSRMRARMEREPVRFFMRDLEAMLDEARAEVGAFVDADPDDLAFVPNATAGVNAVLRSLRFSPGDELLTTDHEYAACKNALDYVALRSGARVVVAKVPFPIDHEKRVTEAILAAVTDKTKLALVDHVTSPTGLVVPIADIVRELAARGVDTLVDGAHAPGMLPLSIRTIGAAYYTGNCHKWVCAPKGAALFHVRRDKQPGLVPVATSHGYAAPRSDRSRFRLEHDWTGTHDPTAYLAVPVALRFLGTLLPGGIPALMAHNREKALAARDELCRALGVPSPSPDSMIGSLAAVPLPDGASTLPTRPPLFDPLQDLLFEKYRIEVPIGFWPAPPKRLIRVSAQIYNAPEEYRALGVALQAALAS